MTVQPHQPPPPPSRSRALTALVARLNPRRYLKAIVIEAIREERLEANLRALEYEAALMASMSRHPSNPYAPFGRDPDDRGPSCHG